MSADPKCKICRRAGEKLFLKGERCFTPKCAMVRHSNPPGIHGGKKKGGRRRTASEYGSELREKQKIRFMYGLTEHQLEKYVAEARETRASVTNTIVRDLETRLDNAVFRAGFAVSRSVGRHLVSYGHMLVNQKPVSSPGYRIKKGDVMAIRPESKETGLFEGFAERIKKYEPPAWLSLDKNQHTATVIAEPSAENTQFTYDLQKVIQYYSK